MCAVLRGFDPHIATSDLRRDQARCPARHDSILSRVGASRNPGAVQTSPLNLIGKLEGWGIGPATPVAEVSIKVSAGQNTQITGAQLKELLKKLPDGMTFELSLEKEDN